MAKVIVWFGTSFVFAIKAVNRTTREQNKPKKNKNPKKLPSGLMSSSLKYLPLSVVWMWCRYSLFWIIFIFSCICMCLGVLSIVHIYGTYVCKLYHSLWLLLKFMAFASQIQYRIKCKQINRNELNFIFLVQN